MSFRIVLAIVRKDLTDAVRNLYVLFAIVLPVGLSFVFNLMLPGDGGVQIGAVAVYDQGGSKLVQMLRDTPLVKRVVETGSVDELTRAVRGDAVGGLVLSADFDVALAAERTPDITVLLNGRRGGAELAAFRRLVDDDLRALAARPDPVRLVVSDVSQASAATQLAGPSVQGFFLVMLLIMGLAMTGTFVVPTLLAEEKEKHTLKAILVSPASYADVVMGKALVGLSFSLLIAIVILALNGGFRGNLLLMALAVVLGSLCLVEVGLLLGAVCKTSAQVNSWSSVVMLAMFGPTFLSFSPLPEPVQIAARILPTYFVDELATAARAGRGLGEVWSSVAALVGFCAVLFVALVWLLRRSERQGL